MPSQPRQFALSIAVRSWWLNGRLRVWRSRGGVVPSMTKEQTMSVLRMRMIEDMKLAGLSAKTQEVYLQAVIALVKRYGNRSPDQLTEEEVRRYLLEVRERNARGTFKARHYG